MYTQLRRYVSRLLRRTKFGTRVYFLVNRSVKDRSVDYEFPRLISIELASACNLNCLHCPPHSAAHEERWRRYGFIDRVVFNKAMDEIDRHGKRKIYLHKDGEPLLHPELPELLSRLKKNVGHQIYLTTNASLLTEPVSRLIINSGIDIVNFSIGAFSPESYRQIRGGDLVRVTTNILRFIDMVKESGRRPRMISQIIDLPGHVTKEEIKKFRRFWHDRGVEVQVWEELTWGVKVDPKRGDYRYPCFSLWESFNINADGKVTACCMDWEQKLVLGDFSRQTIAEIWKGDKLEEYRRLHVCNEIDRMPPCITCNYWRWQPMIGKYRVGP